LITFATQYVIPLGISGLAYGAIVRRVFEFNNFFRKLNQIPLHFLYFPIKLWMRSFVGAVTDNQRVRQDRAKRKTIQMVRKFE
jgi:hypothetical protein